MGADPSAPMPVEAWIAEQLALAPRPTDAQIGRAVTLLKTGEREPARVPEDAA